MERSQAKDAQDLYDNRAAECDTSWHARFTTHLVELLDLRPGEQVLDLACGTGLLTFKASDAVGTSGSVVGIDISTGMLAEARTKLERRDLENVQLYQHSITDLTSLSELHSRAFDVISCASALVLLPDPEEALKQWTQYLKPGGRLITDATHPRTFLPGIVLERVGGGLDVTVPSYREAFQRPKDLADILRAVGLVDIEIKRMSQLSSRDGSDELQGFISDAHKPLIAKEYAVSDAAAVFDAQVASPFGAFFVDEPIRSQAKKLFEEEWAELADEDGLLTEADEVFVGIGWKPAKRGNDLCTIDRCSLAHLSHDSAESAV